MTEDSSFYKKRLIDIGNSRLSEVQASKSKYMAGKTSITEDMISEIAENIFMVQSQSDSATHYSVDMT